MTSEQPRTRVVILGGGTAGWMTAALWSSGCRSCTVRLIESEEIGIVGVGEATLPHIRYFVERLGIDEAEFMGPPTPPSSSASISAIWRQSGQAICIRSAFSEANWNGVPFHHYWLRLHAEERAATCSTIRSPTSWRRRTASRRPGRPQSSLSTYNYAYQFDATLFAPVSARLCRRAGRGANRRHGRRRSSAIAKAAMSQRSPWRTASASRATCSSIARAFARC